MKILITGATGMLGFDLCNILTVRHNVSGIARKGFVGNEKHKNFEFFQADITEKENITRLIRTIVPELIIHTAAISDVDYCELNNKIALKVNSLATRDIASIAKEIRAQLIYISTDYVFDGRKDRPYLEDDLTNPVNYYGTSKLQGEGFVKKILKKYLIIRSSRMFGKGRRNFIDATLESAKKYNMVKAISDKRGCVTYTLDLAKAISDLIDKMQLDQVPFGIYHLTNEGVCSRYQIAKAILEYSNIEADVAAITSKDAGGPAARPAMSALDNTKIKTVLGYDLRHYTQALKEYLSN